MNKKLLLNLTVMLTAGILAAADTVLDFTALNELPKNIMPYGPNNPKLEVATVNGKTAVQSNILRKAAGRSNGGMAIRLTERIPWDQFDSIKITVLEADKSLLKLECLVYDEFNHVWRANLPPSFDSDYVFSKDVLKYNYTESKVKPQVPPTEKVGKIKMLLINVELRKGDEKTVKLIIPEIRFEKNEKK